MKRMERLILPLLLAAGGFFSSGCAAIRTAAGDAAEGALEKSKAWVQNEIAVVKTKLDGKLKELEDKVEAKLLEKEAKELASLDEQLAQFGTVDPVTGAAIKKTWKDFDIDKSGHLEAGELAKIAAFVTMEGLKKVAAGQMTKDQFTDTEKKVGGSVVTLGAVGAGLAIINRRKKKAAEAKGQPPAAAPPPPPDPTKPADATVAVK